MLINILGLKVLTFLKMFLGTVIIRMIVMCRISKIILINLSGRFEFL